MQGSDDPRTFEDLVALVARLHAPAPAGCPWCLGQTPESLAAELVKEAYEVADAAGRKSDTLGQEIGDVLLNILGIVHLLAASGQGTPPLPSPPPRGGEEADTLPNPPPGGGDGADATLASATLGAIVTDLHAKVVRRHPHIFGDAVAETTDDALKNWDAAKRGEGAAEASILDGIPIAMPALMRADEIQQRVARVGFDWPDVNGVLDKIREEMDELRAASTPEDKMEEMGDLLFAMGNLARWMGISPERALQSANTKFTRRFQSIEAQCLDRGVRPEDLTLDDLEAMWSRAKKEERGS